MTTPPPHQNPTPKSTPGAVGPPTKHQLALMIWLAVFPTLLVLNLALGDWLRTTDTGPAHLRARDHRGADRHLRPDAAAAPAPQTATDPKRRLGPQTPRCPEHHQLGTKTAVAPAAISQTHYADTPRERGLPGAHGQGRSRTSQRNRRRNRQRITPHRLAEPPGHVVVAAVGWKAPTTGAQQKAR